MDDETYLLMLQEIERLRAENAQLRKQAAAALAKAEASQARADRLFDLMLAYKRAGLSYQEALYRAVDHEGYSPNRAREAIPARMYRRMEFEARLREIHRINQGKGKSDS